MKICLVVNVFRLFTLDVADVVELRPTIFSVCPVFLLFPSPPCPAYFECSIYMFINIKGNLLN